MVSLGSDGSLNTSAEGAHSSHAVDNSRNRQNRGEGRSGLVWTAKVKISLPLLGKVVQTGTVRKGLGLGVAEVHGRDFENGLEDEEAKRIEIWLITRPRA